MIDITLTFVAGMIIGGWLVVRFMVPVALSIDPNRVDADLPDSGERG